MMWKMYLAAATLSICLGTTVAESLPPLNGAEPPKTYEDLWADFDPQAEPLDVEVLKEWAEDGVVLKVLRYRIGTFKGETAMMAAVYGYPKGGSNLPGLVQIHGGGQYADYRAPLTNAKRGYATISISWAGRINAPDYKVTPAEVKLFWENKTDDPKYKVITDWGALDGYHAPCKNPKNNFASVKPEAWTLDEVESPRNNPWFLCTLGARRALTFLEQQPEVDKTKLGVYGHSMGGKLTVLTAGSDSRVKAAAPSCGGISNRNTGEVLFDVTLADDNYLKNIACPIIFLSPANDFHGRMNDLQTAVTEIQTDEWRVTCAAHHNHQDTANYEVASQLWFDEHLKGVFQTPTTPQLAVMLKTGKGSPGVMVDVDDSMPIVAVDIFYSRHGQVDGAKDDRENTKARFWHHVTAKMHGDKWMGRLPLENVDQPLWVYANVTYKLDDPISYAGYYYRVGETDQFNLSSLMFMATGDELKAGGAEATIKPSLTIEAFEEGWKKEWFTYRPAAWGRKTHKVYDEQWKAPEEASLAFEVKSAEKNTMVVGVDAYAAEVMLEGGGSWQSVMLTPADLRDATGTALPDWKGIRELRLVASDSLKAKVDGEDIRLKLGGSWKGPDPEFRNLRWTKSK